MSILIREKQEKEELKKDYRQHLIVLEIVSSVASLVAAYGVLVLLYMAV
jgi:hypothetical protein